MVRKIVFYFEAAFFSALQLFVLGQMLWSWTPTLAQASPTQPARQSRPFFGKLSCGCVRKRGQKAGAVAAIWRRDLRLACGRGWRRQADTGRWPRWFCH